MATIKFVGVNAADLLKAGQRLRLTFQKSTLDSALEWLPFVSFDMNRKLEEIRQTAPDLGYGYSGSFPEALPGADVAVMDWVVPSNPKVWTYEYFGRQLEALASGIELTQMQGFAVTQTSAERTADRQQTAATAQEQHDSWLDNLTSRLQVGGGILTFVVVAVIFVYIFGLPKLTKGGE